MSDRRTVFLGYNGTQLPGMTGCLAGGCPRGLLGYDERPSTDDYSDCTGVDAEMNVIKTAAQNVGKLKIIDSSMYITREPCRDCRSAAVNTYGVREIFWLPSGSLGWYDPSC